MCRGSGPISLSGERNHPHRRPGAAGPRERARGVRVTGRAAAWPETGRVDEGGRPDAADQAGAAGGTGKIGEAGAAGGAHRQETIEETADESPIWSPWLAEYETKAGTRRRAHLAVHLNSPRNGRHFVGAALADWRLWPLADYAMTCTSELVTNAVRHAIWPLDCGFRRVITVSIATYGNGVVVEVHDLDPRMPVVKPRPDFSRLSEGLLELSEGGEGLRVVAGLADKFGARQLAQGKSTWFLLAGSPDSTNPVRV